MKQTAVEWLENEFQEMCKDFGGLHTDFIERFKQAKAMEKEQSLKMLPYDLDELAEIEYPICEVWNDEEALIRKLYFKKGFQKALDLLTFKSE